MRPLTIPIPASRFHRQLPIYINNTVRGLHPVLSFHYHEGVELVIVVNGKGTHLVPPFSSRIEKGDVLLLPMGVYHAYNDMENFELLNIDYDSLALPLPYADADIPPSLHRFFPATSSESTAEIARPIMHLDSKSLRSCIALGRKIDMEMEQAQLGSNLLCLSYLLQLIIKLGRLMEPKESSEQPRFILGGILRLMHQNYARKITIEELCQQINMSRRNLHRYFQLSMGMPPMEYLMKIRLGKAAELLSGTTFNIDEISERCGFCNASYMSKLFKREYNVSPTRYRHLHDSNMGLSEIPANAEHPLSSPPGEIHS